MFDLAEKALDAVALLVEDRAEAGLPFAVYHGRDTGPGAGRLDLATQPIGAIGLVDEDDGLEGPIDRSPSPCEPLPQTGVGRVLGGSA